MFNLNSRLVKELPEGMGFVQRGLYYADSLFETIRVFQGRIPLMARHWARLSRGLGLMGYDVPADWSGAFFEQEILRIAPGNARVRLTVWRSSGGLFNPENNTPQFLIAAQALESDGYEWLPRGIRLGFCKSVRLPLDDYSGLKTLNAARYVAAAQEAEAKGMDDMVILNASGHVCETTNSNVFWLEEDTLCTPPLTDGCVTGVMRELLLALTNGGGYVIKEKSATFADLLAADEVFLTNAVRGIRWVRECEGKVFESSRTAAVYELLVSHFSQKNS